MLIALAAVFFLPIVMIVLTALMTERQALTPALWPRPFRWSNFSDVFREIPLLKYTWNTFRIAALATIGRRVVRPCRLRAVSATWRGRQGAFLLVLSTLMLPVQVTIVPLYIVFVRLGWIGSIEPLVVPLFFGDAFTIFLLRQFFLTIPEELSDAARVDGANEFQIMTCG